MLCSCSPAASVTLLQQTMWCTRSTATETSHCASSARNQCPSLNWTTIMKNIMHRSSANCVRNLWRCSTWKNTRCEVCLELVFSTLPQQCWKSKIQALPQIIGFSLKRANSLSQSAPNPCSDSQVFHRTIRLARAITWHSLWAWLWLSLCLCLP